MKAKHLTVWKYFEQTWWGLVPSAVATGVQAELFRKIYIGIVTLAAVLTLIPMFYETRYRRALRGVSTVLAFCLGLAALLQFIAERDTLCFIAEMLAAFLPFILAFRTKNLGYWLSLWTCFLLALTGVVAEAELPEYLFFIAVLALVVVNLNAANLFFLAGESRAKTHSLPPGYFKQFIAAGLAGFSIGAMIFIFFPRDIAWSSPFGVRQKYKQTGYSGTVSLDGTPEIQESTTLVFQFQGSDPLWTSQIGTNLYFRGNVLEQFDGTNWNPRLEKVKSFRDSRALAYSRPAGRYLSRLTIYREPSPVRVVFYPWLLQSIDFLGNWRPGLGYDTGATLYFAQPEFRRYAYEVAVLPPVLPREWALTQVHAATTEWRNDRRWESYLQRYLEIPESVRKADFFKKWTKEVLPELKRHTTYAEVVRTLKQHFKEKFVPTFKHEYTGNSAFASFLTDRRQGHCEYFASAAALFFRQLGIPARIVVGYFGGTYNAISQVVEVRELNAHAWVEIFEPNLGWVTVDPTPPVKGPVAALPVQLLLEYVSALEFWFNRYVIHYNAATQKSLWRNFWRDFSGAFYPRNTGLSSTVYKGLRWSDLRDSWPKLVCLAAMLFSLVMWIRRRKQKSLSSLPPLPDYYRALVRRLKKRRLVRQEAESHRAFLRRAQAVLPLELLQEITHALEADLYAPGRQGRNTDLLSKIRKLV